MRIIFPALLFLLLVGCSPLNGILYHHVKLPLTADLDNTPAHGTTASGKVIRIKEPISGYGLYGEINTNAIYAVAKQNGLQKVYFADREIFSILGIWTNNIVHIYGE